MKSIKLKQIVLRTDSQPFILGRTRFRLGTDDRPGRQSSKDKISYIPDLRCAVGVVAGLDPVVIPIESILFMVPDNGGFDLPKEVITPHEDIKPKPIEAAPVNPKIMDAISQAPAQEAGPGVHIPHFDRPAGGKDATAKIARLEARIKELEATPDRSSMGAVAKGIDAVYDSETGTFIAKPTVKRFVKDPEEEEKPKRGRPKKKGKKDD